MFRTIVMAVAASLLPTLAAAQTPQSRKVARDLATEGIELHRQGNHAEAAEKLDRAYGVLNAPTIALWEARALRDMGRLVAAYEHYQLVLRSSIDEGSPAVYQKAVEEAASEQQALNPRIPKLTIHLENAEPQNVDLFVDGHPLEIALVGIPAPVDPGERRIEAVRGEERIEIQVALAEGESREATFRFESVSSPAPLPATPTSPQPSMDPPPTQSDSGSGNGSTQRLLGWSAIGIGGAGLVLGVVGQVIGQGKESDIDSTGECVGVRCPSSMAGDIETLDTMRVLSISGFTIGGIGIAAGSALLLLSSKTSNAESATVQPWLGLGSAGVRGRF